MLPLRFRHKAYRSFHWLDELPKILRVVWKALFFSIFREEAEVDSNQQATKPVA